MQRLARENGLRGLPLLKNHELARVESVAQKDVVRDRFNGGPVN
jgi:hypothetical protein